MKTGIIMATVLFSIFFSPQAFSARMSEARPTDCLRIAMKFYKMAGIAPDFKRWEELTAGDYQSIESLKNEDTSEGRVTKMKNDFSMMSPYEPIILNIVSPLSAYDSQRRGISVERLSDNDMLFPADCVDEHFGLVPEGMQDMSVIAVPQDIAEAIRAHTDNGANARVEIQLSPLAVLDEGQTEYKGVRYKPMRVVVQGVRIWSADGNDMLWELHPAGNALQGLFSQDGQ